PTRSHSEVPLAPRRRARPLPDLPRCTSVRGMPQHLADVIRPPRPLSESETRRLLERDVPARLATVDGSGFPHVTPLWFVWAEGAFHLTSFRDRRHVARLRGNPRAGVCVDVEA